MHKIFKCDCGDHLIEFEYSGISKDFNFEELSIIIREVHNPRTGRKHKIPTLSGDVMILNSASPRELDNFFKFLEQLIKNRKKPKRTHRRKQSPCMKNLDKTIKNLKERTKEIRRKEKIKIAKMKKLEKRLRNNNETL